MGWKPEEVWFAFCHHGLLGTVRVPAAESQPALQNLAYLAEWPWCAPLKQGWNESLSTRTGDKAGRWAEIATSCTFKFRICLWPLQQNFPADTLKIYIQGLFTKAKCAHVHRLPTCWRHTWHVCYDRSCLLTKSGQLRTVGKDDSDMFRLSFRERDRNGNC